MTPERWQQIDKLFHSILELEPSQRAAFLAQVCAGDESLRREVESLLASHNQAGSFYEASASDLAAEFLGASHTQSIVGRTIGHYQILSLLGAGGMGEVYLAKDTKLSRHVAIKVLRNEFASDRDRLTRFQREARTLATLNHPNIAAIYGFEEAAGSQFLVLEYVEGETVAERLIRGPLSIEETLTVCVQIAEGLSAAHQAGVVHRDVKPGNLKLLLEGKVKILDFGLAKPILPVPGSELSQPPAFPYLTTQSGVILGTPAYMSPEQLRGKPLDQRTDIWSFGCILYECLTGRRVFTGDTVSDTIVTILKQEPDWSLLPGATPGKVQDLVRRCLQKNPRQRLHDIADARIEIEEALAKPWPANPAFVAAARHEKGWRRVGWSLASLTVLIAALAAWVAWDTAPPPQRPLARFVLNLPQGVSLEGSGSSALALSPDGRQLIYVARQGDTSRLYRRRIDEFEAVPIPGSEGARAPFFSPDGIWLGFFAGGKLKKLSLEGGAPVILCDAGTDFSSGSWGQDGNIFFGAELKLRAHERTADEARRLASAIWRVSAAGGVPQAVTTPQGQEQSTEWHYTPQILPGGKALLFAIVQSPKQRSIAMRSLQTGEQRILIERGTAARYVPTGHLIYAWAGELLAVPFDIGKLEVTGSPVSVLEDIRTGGWFFADYSISENGSLVYVPGSRSLVYVPGSEAVTYRTLVWVDRKGEVEPLPLPPGLFSSLRLSPDGRRLLTVKLDEGLKKRFVWINDLERGVWQRLTGAKANEHFAIWSPDGRWVAFNSDHGGSGFPSLYWKPVDSSAARERLSKGTFGQSPQSWSPNGKVLAFVEGVHPDTGIDIWMLPLEGDRKPHPFLNTRSNEIHPAFSPDGRWLAYASNLSGRYEVYVQPYPGPGGMRRISAGGGSGPLWAPDRAELYYRDLSGHKVMALSFRSEPGLSVGRPRLLFEGDYTQPDAWDPRYDLTSDAQRFVMIKEPEQAAATQINVVFNWSEELKRLVPPAK